MFIASVCTLQNVIHWCNVCVLCMCTCPHIAIFVFSTQALFNASHVLSEKETSVQIATPTKKYIGFEPQKWQDSNWVVHATSTSQVCNKNLYIYTYLSLFLFADTQ